MSDRSSTREIEDVLSSIRRLVSEDEPVTKGNGTEAETLVLTSAQRIVAVAQPLKLETPLVVPEAPAPKVTETVPSRPMAQAGIDPAREEAIVEASLEASLLELEAEIEARATRWQNGFDAVASDAPAEAEEYDDWETVGEATIGVFHRSQAQHADAGAAGAKASAPEAADAEATDAVSKGAGTAASLPETGSDEDVIGNIAMPDAESLLDEHDLRALVAEVLREELKGALGERITRNVRKLVRREIAHALSSLELE